MFAVQDAARLAVVSSPSITFSVTVKTGTSMKCWCTMPMPPAMASLGNGPSICLPRTMISPFVGLVQAIQDVHQGGFAGAIFPQQGMDLALFQGQVDMVIGQHAAENAC